MKSLIRIGAVLALSLMAIAAARIYARRLSADEFRIAILGAACLVLLVWGALRLLRPSTT